MAILTADSTGKILGKFTIPANVPAGVKEVAAVGNSGTKATGSFTSRGRIVNQVRRRIEWIRIPPRERKDPLAQTFMLPQTRHIAAVDLWFTVAGTNDIVVQLRETDNGVPNQVVIGEASITAATVNLAGHTRITFPSPVILEGEREYALVLLTDSAVAAVATAELGKFDAANQRWITSQPYQVGVLLSSSNASTWTAHQDRDLAFRLLACKFSPTTKTVSLGNVTLTNTSDLLALMNIESPATGASAKIIAGTNDGTVYSLLPFVPANLSERENGAMALQAELTGTETASPVIYPGMQFAAGNIQTSGTYVSRQFDCGTSARIAVTFEALLPGTSTVLVEVQRADLTWQTVALTTGVAVGDGWVERRHITTGFTATKTRVRLTITGTEAYRPRIRKLRCVATD